LQALTFTATVTPASGSGETGTVQFQIDGGNAGSPVALWDDTASFTTSSLSGGNHTVLAVYSGDSTFLGSTSPVLTQNVICIGTTTGITAGNSASSYGQSVSFTAWVGPIVNNPPPVYLETGTVQFQIDGGNVGSPQTVAGYRAGYACSNLTVGSHSVVAVYSGDGNFAASTSPPFALDVTRAATTTAVRSSNGPTAYGQPVTFTATTTPGAGNGETGNVQFQIDGGNVGSPVALSGNTATFTTSTLSAGSHTVAAVYSGDGNFASSTSPSLVQTVTGIATSATVASNNATPSYGQPVTFTATVTPASGSGETGNVTFQLDGGDLSTVALVGNTATYTTSALGAGSHTIVAIDSGDSNFAGSTSPTFTQTVTGTASVTQAVYRLYSPVTLEHLYTSDVNEYDTLKQEVGTWSDEGNAYQDYASPRTIDGVADEPLYRLYNPSIKQHLWTTALSEYTTLATEGWNQEGDRRLRISGGGGVAGQLHADLSHERAQRPLVDDFSQRIRHAANRRVDGGRHHWIRLVEKRKAESETKRGVKEGEWRIDNACNLGIVNYQLSIFHYPLGLPGFMRVLVRLPKIGPAGLGAQQPLFLPPRGNLGVIAAEQYVRHGHVAKFARPGVLRIFD